MPTESTYREMTVEHLGADATELDLAAFVAACEAYQAETGADDAETTDYVWNDGGCWERVSRWAPDEASVAEGQG